MQVFRREINLIKVSLNLIMLFVLKVALSNSLSSQVHLYLAQVRVIYTENQPKTERKDLQQEEIPPAKRPLVP